LFSLQNNNGKVVSEEVNIADLPKRYILYSVIQLQKQNRGECVSLFNKALKGSVGIPFWNFLERENDKTDNG
jgi:hypothetical protein